FRRRPPISATWPGRAFPAGLRRPARTAALSPATADVPGRGARRRPSAAGGRRLACAPAAPADLSLQVGSRSVRVLVIGGGGREHAIVRGLSADPAVTELHCAPG